MQNRQKVLVYGNHVEIKNFFAELKTSGFASCPYFYTKMINETEYQVWNMSNQSLSRLVMQAYLDNANAIVLVDAETELSHLNKYVSQEDIPEDCLLLRYDANIMTPPDCIESIREPDVNLVSGVNEKLYLLYAGRQNCKSLFYSIPNEIITHIAVNLIQKEFENDFSSLRLFKSRNNPEHPDLQAERKEVKEKSFLHTMIQACSIF